MPGWLRPDSSSQPLPRLVPVGRAQTQGRIRTASPPWLRRHLAGSEGPSPRRSASATAAQFAVAGAAEVDAHRLTHTVLRQATDRGARVYDRTEVTGVRTDAEGVTLDTHRDASIRAKRVVVATGYEVARRLGKARGHCHSTWACVSEPFADFSWWPERCLIWETSRPYTYLRTTDDCRVMIGGEDEPWSSRHQNTSLLSKKAKRLMAQFSTLFPETQ